MSAEQSHGFDIQDDVRYCWGATTSQSNIHDEYDIPTSIISNWNMFPFSPRPFHSKAVGLNSKNPYRFPQGTIGLSDSRKFISQTQEYAFVVALHIPWGGGGISKNTHIKIVQLIVCPVSMEKHREFLGDLTLEHATAFNEYIHSLSGHKDERRQAAQIWKKTNLKNIQSFISLNPKIDENQCRVQASLTFRRMIKVIDASSIYRMVHPDFDPNSINSAPDFMKALASMFRNYRHKERDL